LIGGNSAAQGATNVLINPGFEQPDASGGDQYAIGGAVIGWLGFNGAYMTATTKESGNQSFKAFGSPGGAYEDFPASPGDVWTGTVDSENFSADPLIGQQGTFINIEWHDGGGGLISFLSTPIANSTSPTDTWLPGVVSGTAPAGTATARIVMLCGPYTGIGTGSGGAGFFDNATFSVAQAPEPASLAAAFVGFAGLALRRARARR
jgi:hypothetical protein